MQKPKDSISLESTESVTKKGNKACAIPKCENKNKEFGTVEIGQSHESQLEGNEIENHENVPTSELPDSNLERKCLLYWCYYYILTILFGKISHIISLKI